MTPGRQLTRPIPWRRLPARRGRGAPSCAPDPAGPLSRSDRALRSPGIDLHRCGRRSRLRGRHGALRLHRGRALLAAKMRPGRPSAHPIERCLGMTAQNTGVRATSSQTRRVMSPEAVATMERQLLEAFSHHHHLAGPARRHRARWMGIAAALAFAAAAGVTSAQPARRSRTAAGHDGGTSHGFEGSREHRVGQRPWSGCRKCGPANVVGRRWHTAEAVPTGCSFRSAGCGGGQAGRVCRAPGGRQSPEVREWLDRPHGCRALLAGRTRRRHFSRRRQKPGPADVLVGQDGEPRAIRLVNSSRNR